MQTISNKQKKRRNIYNRDKGECYLCGRALTFQQMTLDHVIPRSFGGWNTIDNLRCCCEQCNHYKSKAEDFMSLPDIRNLEKTILRAYSYFNRLRLGVVNG